MIDLIIDIETYSEVDLPKCDVYRYAEDNKSELLLFAYSFYFGEVKVVDVASGEKIPNFIINAIFDEKINLMQATK